MIYGAALIYSPKMVVASLSGKCGRLIAILSRSECVDTSLMRTEKMEAITRYVLPIYVQPVLDLAINIR
jgi:hypothetical protein